MRKLLIAFLTTPLATLTAMWLGQYLFPVMQMGWATETSGRWTYSTGRAPLELVVFILPSKLSIPYAIATYAVMAACSPVLYLLHRLRCTSFGSVASTGVLLATLIALAFFSFAAVPVRRLVTSSETLQVLGHAQLMGLASTSWFWWVGIRGNAWLGRCAPTTADAPRSAPSELHPR